MGWTLIAILIFIGLLFLVLEILVFPGQAVAGIIGLVIITVAIWQTYIHIGTSAGHITLASTLGASVILLIVALRSKTWKYSMLSDNIDGKVNLLSDEQIKKGDSGKTVSRLNPAGKALINDDYFEVHTQGDYIDPGTEIIVTKIEFNKIYVKQKTN
ncbi:MAG: hypothetical protein K9G67_06900 [Bacteroidales bacterium]|nr:hypothetical protein [Bacteroidales bacterium]MCF8349627.1 hypothetical protein [Bacteroidales bacterium]MCF8376068.1 hypothetical protein [Bacteroidales bacterium]MCF8400399.1 hypothetical protein [Bacteroidales bacterium]